MVSHQFFSTHLYRKILYVFSCLIILAFLTGVSVQGQNQTDEMTRKIEQNKKYENLNTENNRNKDSNENLVNARVKIKSKEKIGTPPNVATGKYTGAENVVDSPARMQYSKVSSSVEKNEKLSTVNQVLELHILSKKLMKLKLLEDPNENDLQQLERIEKKIAKLINSIEELDCN